MFIFSSLYESTWRYCCHFDVDISVGVTLKHLMGKALSEEIFCTQTVLIIRVTETKIQPTLVILNIRISRRENLVLVLIQKSKIK